MNKLVGIDVGTSSLKVMVTNEKLEVLDTYRVDYGINQPFPHWAEQDPNRWWNAVCGSFQALNLDGCSITIGLSGQMHGLVAVDVYGQPVRPSIIWADNRSSEELQKILLHANKENVYNIWLGTLLPSLLWVKENEPEVYSKIDKVMLPKDYIRYKLTGEIATEHSDACGTGAYSFFTQNWDFDLLEKLGINPSLFPPIHRSTDIAGMLIPEVAHQLMISEQSKVAYGGSDHSMQLLGNSIFSKGILNCNIGTGSQISLTSKFHKNKRLEGLSIFSHAVGDLTNIVGTSLNGGSVLQWVKGLAGGTFSYTEFDRLAEGVSVGSNDLVFLPYLNGERNHPHAKGVFFGLTTSHTLAHLVRATMEGMIYGLRDILEDFKNSGLEYERVISSGGGTKSRVLLQMQADIFDCDIYVCDTKEQAAMGAAIIAGLSIGTFESLGSVEHLLKSKMKLMASPIKENVEEYRKGFELFRKVYNRNFREGIE
ncbi:xylulokinase [Pseudoneobacillus rhizosphaerae]|uniref:Xylulose kinase n=1 Tax=Pseudoneobacillus rhizosphaerae TaxID=2880968 RepID=A0A9C7G8X5_9BACI|nr:xylulokinase [Pseudoneobacillus rhizosphaerae]CAG9607763.1 Xylulose kinase [Pseudoneobacillus rhizosphaerae]